MKNYTMSELPCAPGGLNIYLTAHAMCCVAIVDCTHVNHVDHYTNIRYSYFVAIETLSM